MLRFGTVLRVASALVAFGCAYPDAARAQVATGARAGISVNPDQVYFGGHIQSQPLFDRLRARPNVELGFGDDVTALAFNFEFIYPFPSRQPWHLYAGAGPAVTYYRSNGSGDSQGGFNILFGAENAKGMFFEAKFGTFDSPDMKIGVGFTFK